MAKKTSYTKRERTQSAATSRRAQMQAAQQAELARRKRTRVILVAVAVVVVVIALVLVVIWQSRPKPVIVDDKAAPTASATTQPPGSQPPGSAPASSTAAPFIPPHGTAEMGYITVAGPNPKPDALVVHEHIDYQCPICAYAATYYGPAFDQLIASGDIIFQAHIRSFIDKRYPGQHSLRAAMAATCADTVGAFLPYHETIFANQPATEGDGYTDEQLRVTFAAAAGITGDKLAAFQACYDTRRTEAYATAMNTVNADSRTINGGDMDPPTGTPAWIVGGHLVSINMFLQNVPIDQVTPAGLLAYLKSAAQG